MNDTSTKIIQYESPALGLDLAARKSAVEDVLNKVAFTNEVVTKLMKEGEHYGKIPGCGDKPVLLQPGAEKLQFAFRLAPVFHETIIDHPNLHREYQSQCDIYTLSGVRLTEGYPGKATTLESKFRFRTAPKKLTDRPVPAEYWKIRGSNPVKAQDLLGGKGFVAAKNESGQWVIAIQGERVEHDNPADYWNICSKMAAKRAFVGAILKATGCSDFFTQDLEDAQEDLPQINPSKNVTPPVEKSPPNIAPTQERSAIPEAPKAAPPLSPTLLEQVLVLAGQMRGNLEDYIRNTKTSKGAYWLLPNETLEDLTPAQLEILIAHWPEMMDKVDAYILARDGLAPSASGAGSLDAPTGEDHSIDDPKNEWESSLTPFDVAGQPKGTRLGDLPKNALWWWCVKWEPKPFRGVISKEDKLLRRKLDLARAHYQFTEEKAQ